MKTETIEMHPIGYVRSNIPDDAVPKSRRAMVVDIELDEKYNDALLGIEEYSHLFVLFWMHRFDRAAYQPTVHPRGDESLPLTGVLATRTRARPNPIGLSVVELIERRGNRVRVRKLDAYDGTPVLDIKPYDDYDCAALPRVPAWWAERNRKG